MAASRPQKRSRRAPPQVRSYSLIRVLKCTVQDEKSYPTRFVNPFRKQKETEKSSPPQCLWNAAFPVANPVSFALHTSFQPSQVMSTHLSMVPWGIARNSFLIAEIWILQGQKFPNDNAFLKLSHPLTSGTELLFLQHPSLFRPSPAIFFLLFAP